MSKLLLRMFWFIISFFSNRKVKVVEREAEKHVDTIDDGQPMSDELNRLLNDPDHY